MKSLFASECKVVCVWVGGGVGGGGEGGRSVGCRIPSLLATVVELPRKRSARSLLLLCPPPSLLSLFLSLALSHSLTPSCLYCWLTSSVRCHGEALGHSADHFADAVLECRAELKEPDRVVARA